MDEGAGEEIERRTEEASEGGAECERMCTNLEAPWSKTIACCDTIYLPSLLVSNVAEYSNTNFYYKIGLCGGNSSSILWSVKVTATYYTAMMFKAFPFDKQDLVVQFEQPDNYRYNFGAVQYNLSASGVSKRFDQGFESGDAVSGWDVQGIKMQMVKTNYTDVYKNVDPSSAGDTCTFNPGEGIDLTHDLITLDSIQISVRVRRYAGYYIVASIIPILVIGAMNFAIFLFSPDEMAERFSTLVTLLLALMAVQFVVNADLPASSYPLPQQGVIIATYCLTLIMTIESFLVYRIYNLKRNIEKKRELEEAYRLEQERTRAVSSMTPPQSLEDNGLYPPPQQQEQEQQGPPAGNGGSEPMGVGAAAPVGKRSVDGVVHGVAASGVVDRGGKAGDGATGGPLGPGDVRLQMEGEGELFCDAQTDFISADGGKSMEVVAGGSSSVSSDTPKPVLARVASKVVPSSVVDMGRQIGKAGAGMVDKASAMGHAANGSSSMVDAKRVWHYTLGRQGLMGKFRKKYKGVDDSGDVPPDDLYLHWLARKIDGVTFISLMISYTVACGLIFAIPAIMYG